MAERSKQMKITKNFGLNMPDEDDFVEIDKINENAENWLRKQTHLAATSQRL